MSNDVELINSNPQHIAIIMDGNGRWAQKRHLPRIIGHNEGVKSAHKMIQYCTEKKILALTLFAFSSENWRRPKEEVSMIMSLFISTLEKELEKWHQQGIRFLCIGDKTAFSEKLQQVIAHSEKKTQYNQGLTLTIAANYGGRWDMKQAFQAMSKQILTGELNPDSLTETDIDKYLTTAKLPTLDLFIRTGGEQRVSNFLLWQLAYAELYFTSVLWPDFNQAKLEEAIICFRGRQRRFGHTEAQILNNQSQ